MKAVRACEVDKAAKDIYGKKLKEFQNNTKKRFERLEKRIAALEEKSNNQRLLTE